MTTRPSRTAWTVNIAATVCVVLTGCGVTDIGLTDQQKLIRDAKDSVSMLADDNDAYVIELAESTCNHIRTFNGSAQTKRSMQRNGHMTADEAEQWIPLAVGISCPDLSATAQLHGDY
ncbi:hypothetical protein R1X32_01825 (plasmid) [Rhodococcus opacus]|nr:hypothetical protein HJ581_0047440 [Rhodococcus opacus]